MKVLLLPFCLLAALAGFAQPDTLKGQSVEITSAYRPVIRSVSKINFSAAQLRQDSSRNLRPYLIPSQNLYYSYKAAPLKPVAMDREEGPVVGDRNFIKAGFGSYSTPYLKATVGAGDGNSYLANAYLNYISSKGKIDNQNFSQFSLGGNGSYFSAQNELYGGVSFRRDNFYQYGYDHSKDTFSRDDTRMRQTEASVSLGIRNTQSGPMDLSYDPNISFSSFSVKDKGEENTLLFDLSAQRNFGTHVTATVNIMGDLTGYSNKEKDTSFSNNIFKIAPAISYTGKLIRAHAGLAPVWDNGQFRLLPDFTAEVVWKDKYSLQAGYIGRLQKNTYKSLISVNPFLEPFSSRNNTRENEFFGGIRAGIGKHFSFTGKVSWITYDNLPLFVNDTSTAKGRRGFIVLNETEANNFCIRGSLSYIDKEKFSVTAGMVLNAFTGLQTNERAWHVLPLEINGSMRWQVFDKLLFKSDAYIFSGGKYRNEDNKASNLNGGIDISAGFEYAIKKQFSAWLQVNNIFSNKYQRWHNYEVFGINILGGLVIRF